MCPLTCPRSFSCAQPMCSTPYPRPSSTAWRRAHLTGNVLAWTPSCGCTAYLQISICLALSIHQACNLVSSVRIACIVCFVPAQVIRIPGYIADEKVHIARQYLEPQSMRESGIPESAASISDDAMHTLIHEYARCRYLLPGLSWTFCRLVIRMWETAFVIQEICFWPTNCLSMFWTALLFL